MIGYITLGSNNLERAGAFYDSLLDLLGIKRLMTMDRMIAWSNDSGQMFVVCKPHDGEAASVGNGVMISLSASSQELVQRAHALALELGAENEGDPGPRMAPFYCGYFRDLDGNKINIFSQ